MYFRTYTGAATGDRKEESIKNPRWSRRILVLGLEDAPKLLTL